MGVFCGLGGLGLGAGDFGSVWGGVEEEDGAVWVGEFGSLRGGFEGAGDGDEEEEEEGEGDATSARRGGSGG